MENTMETLKQHLFDLSACTRALQIWFQGAHHLTKGTGFAGDHNLLYSEIYEAADDEFDGYVERNLGLTNDETVACPKVLMPRVSEYVMDMPCIAGHSALGIAAGGLAIVQHHIEHITQCYETVKASGEMTLGLDDMLMANANAYERLAYLLQQRVKAEMDR